jgi:uncharacterized protein (DUF302 family)|tara:strand:- start:104 stop:490 length:387 start_codon:yes stop_codon:yes gene_type:complete
MNYGYQRTIKKSFENTDKLLRNALEDVGFGIITEINIKKTFKEKLNLEYPQFKILGACNPLLANQALNIQSEVSMLMPCNIVIWENEDSTVTISGVDVEQQLRITDLEDLVQIGRDVNKMLKTAIDKI